MDLFSRNRHKLIAAQAVVVFGLCLALYFLLLRPDSSSRLTGAGVPGPPHAALGPHGDSGPPASGHGRRAGRHRERGRAGARGAGGPNRSVSGPNATLAGDTAGGAATRPGGEPSRPPSLGAPSGSGPTAPYGPGGTQYSSTVAALQAQLAEGMKSP